MEDTRKTMTIKDRLAILEDVVSNLRSVLPVVRQMRSIIGFLIMIRKTNWLFAVEFMI